MGWTSPSAPLRSRGLEGYLATDAPSGGAGTTLRNAPGAMLERTGWSGARTVLHGDVENAIATHVAAAGSDLLVMGAYGPWEAADDGAR